MLTERELRDRPPAVSSGTSDLGLFGGTSGTFHAMTMPTAGAIAGAAWFGADASAQLRAAHGEAGSSGAREVAALAEIDAGMRLTAPSGESIVIQTGASQAFGSSAVRDEDQPAPASSSSSAADATQLSRIETHVTTARADGTSDSHALSQQVSMTSGAVAQQDPAAGSELAQLSQAIQQQITAATALIDAARQETLGEIDALTDSIADEIASLQAGIGSTAAGVAAQAAALTESITASIGTLTAPVLGAVADLPDSIATVVGIDLSLATGLGAALGGQTIELSQSVQATTDATLELALPIGGEDIAGGIDTLVGMVGEQAGYAVGEAGNAAVWLSTLPAPIDALAAIDPFEDALAAPDPDPGAILLGIADTGGDLLGGLHLPDDHGIG